MKCRLLHHASAASNNNNVVLWIDKNTLAYASHGIINLATRTKSLWKIQTTLRTSSLLEQDDSAVITCLCRVNHCHDDAAHALVCGFSSGHVVLWLCDEKEEWTYQVLLADVKGERSVHVVSAAVHRNKLYILTGSSQRAVLYVYQDAFTSSLPVLLSQDSLTETAVCSVSFVQQQKDLLLCLVGTASPRHNKILVYTVASSTSSFTYQYAGALSGHEDWITCMDYSDSNVLATGSQDCKIRLWKFNTRAGDHQQQVEPMDETEVDDDSSSNDDDEEEEDGEARIEIGHQGSIVAVTLDALLLGHESAVTSVQWHDDPIPVYGQEILLSSSMDRSIFLWTYDADGIWTPLSRVGSAGGILGGSVGSSLLGYCHVALQGDCLVGHAYGGALHVFEMQATKEFNPQEKELAVEERASHIQWKAAPCITGHFGPVTDLCWHVDGDYLLTVSKDQTCRLWACSSDSDTWLELGRPQVHGYDLTAVTALSSPAHRIVTGADEKELRVFDAPMSTLRTLQTVAGSKYDATGSDIERVDRAYIPSLGLTNKSTAVDGAEEDEEGASSPETSAGAIPKERDLGVQTIWPEVAKLFGHNTELYCLASFGTLVASSVKARDVDDAAIRLWDISSSKCLQVLKAHKSTVATMSFSTDGIYLATSGKDRRLCLWKRDSSSGLFELAWSKENAHKRILWAVHFQNDKVFASGSRDGCVRIWRIGETNDEAHCVSTFAPSFARNGKPDGVTALAFCPREAAKDGSPFLALGLESGRIELWKICETPTNMNAIPASSCHAAAVTKLAWRPLTQEDEGPLILASCSNDHGCRLFEVNL